MKLSTIAAATGLALGLSTSVFAENESRYIITYKENASQKGRAAMMAKGGRSALRLTKRNAEAVYLSDSALAELKGNKNILKIEEDYKRFPLSIYNDDSGNPMAEQLTPYAVYQSQADQLNLQIASAKKVCIIDSGIAREQGETGGHNPDFDWSVITGSNDSGTGNWYTDGGPHGTHVAGTVAAADNGVGVIGMAPGNPLHIVKVFNAAGWGYSSDLALAADKCTEAGAEIITMSLGGGGANSTEENAFANFTANGGLVLAAAGNDGNNSRSYPAGYSSVMMIGANDADNNIADFSQFPSCKSGRGKHATTDETICVEVTAGGVDTLSTYPGGSSTVAGLTADGSTVGASAMENSGSASGSTYFMGTAESTDAGANGKVCVIDRGNISFHDKVQNCENSGGIGAIIINNESGMLYGTLGDTNATSIPAVGTALEDRTTLLAAGSASISIEAGDYGYMSGTSMATPAAAGIAALVWSNHPQCSGTEIRNALKATAQDQGASGHDDYFGYGIVKAFDASNYLQTNGCAGVTPDPDPDPTPCRGKKCR